MKDKPTAPELADRLYAAGVGVRANLASTGRMNGTPATSKEKPFMRPVLARFARTPTPAAYSRSASSG
ncbi:hypothetical protein, partial [Aeromonas caviae]|uniref:hypothetical protein n=1 Tax=Aeromonas caviae TaxID=648 RepID=UPI001CC81BDE